MGNENNVIKEETKLLVKIIKIMSDTLKTWQSIWYGE